MIDDSVDGNAHFAAITVRYAINREQEIYLDDCCIVSVPGSCVPPPRKVTDALSLLSSAKSGKVVEGLCLDSIRRVFNSCDVRDVVNGTHATAIGSDIDKTMTAVNARDDVFMIHDDESAPLLTALPAPTIIIIEPSCHVIIYLATVTRDP